MKVIPRVLLLLIIAGVRTGPLAQSGWFRQNPVLPTQNTLWSPAVLDLMTVVAVGEGGTIVRTSDGGNTWTLQPSGTVHDLRGVSFVDAYTGTAVGFSGTILRTADGGETWTQQTSGTLNDLYGVSFVDASIGAAVGAAGTILTTTDGGETWTVQASRTTVDLNEVSFVNARVATVVGFVEPFYAPQTADEPGRHSTAGPSL